MPNEPIVELLARSLADGLTHHGDGKPFVLPLPTFRTSGIPPEMAQHFAAEAGLPSTDVAKLTAEAIVHTIETNGDSEIVPKAEINALRAQAAGVEPPARMQALELHCNACFNAVIGGGAGGGMLFDFAVPNKPKINVKNLIIALSNLQPDCPHQPAADN